MAQLELPAPVWTLIVSKLIESNSSESWKTLRLVCKALCARAGYFAKHLRLPVDADLPRNARRCMERGFRADALHLFSKTSSPAAQHDQSEDRTSVLWSLFQLPIWSHLRTLRLQGVNLPESVMLLLPQACPNVQELFLEDVLLDNSNSNASSTSKCDVYNSDAQSRCPLQHTQRELQQEVGVAAIWPAQELPAVAVGLPRRLDVHAYQVQLCSIPAHSITKDPALDMQSNSHSHNTDNRDSVAAARIALILSNLTCLRLLRMDCALAERVMQMLCDIHQRPCMQVQCGSRCALVKGSSSMLEQPLLEYYPLLGWYLFNVTGAPCPASSSSRGESSACRSASCVQPSNTTELQASPAAVSAAIAEAACSSVGSVSESQIVISTGSNISSAQGGLMPGGSSGLPAGIINSSSCPPSTNNSSHQLAALSDNAAAYQAMQEQQLQEAEHVYPGDEVLGACTFAASQSFNTSTGQHGLDVNQQHRSRSSTACNNTGAEANSVSVTDACRGRGMGSFPVSCCNLEEASSADPELCSCGVCSFCSEDGNEEVCNSTVPCSNSTLAPSKVRQGRGDRGVCDARNNSASGAARDDDTILACMDQQH